MAESEEKYSIAGQDWATMDRIKKLEKVKVHFIACGAVRKNIVPQAKFDEGAKDYTKRRRQRVQEKGLGPLAIGDNKGQFRAAVSAETLGTQLRRAREEAGLSQNQVAKSMGTDHRSVRRIEKGDTNPTWETASKFAAAVGLRTGLFEANERNLD